MQASAAKTRFLEDLSVGDSVERTLAVEEQDVVAFADVSGDHNPIHLDEAFAQASPFKGRVAHGMLTAAYISAILGTELPGAGGIYLSQSLTFKRPVRIGAELIIRIRVEAIDAKTGVVTLSTQCHVGRKSVLDGTAEVLVPRRGTA